MSDFDLDWGMEHDLHVDHDGGVDHGLAGDPHGYDQHGHAYDDSQHEDQHEDHFAGETHDPGLYGETGVPGHDDAPALDEPDLDLPEWQLDTDFLDGHYDLVGAAPDETDMWHQFMSDMHEEINPYAAN
ncbi:hypothetical protein [Dactylosporangium sp. CA-233914]|uniref:hypothetical protein n=1 Tax=Dactylosporangium sp. CA-233914 TaxID=3239934 RepID=UPI003D902369